MKVVVAATVAGFAVLFPSYAFAAPDAQQALQGLLTGDKISDRALVDAFQRGYKRGREDELEAQKLKQRQKSNQK